MKSYSVNNSRDKIDEQLEEFALAGVDAPDPDDDVVSNKRKAVDKLNELAEEHGYPYMVTEEDLQENEVLADDGFQAGDWVLLQEAESVEDAFEEFAESGSESPEEPDTDDEDEDEEEEEPEDGEDETKTESEGEGEPNTGKPENPGEQGRERAETQVMEEENEGEDVLKEAKAENKEEAESKNVVGTGPSSASFTHEDDEDGLYEGEINGSKVTGAHEKIHGGMTYVHFQLADGTEKVLPQTAVKNMNNVTRNS